MHPQRVRPPRFCQRADKAKPAPGMRKSPFSKPIDTGYRSLTGTARLKGTTALNAVRALIDGSFALA
ncbi:protein of unknown function [Rhodovastum atsumiense]|nr:protein of unknown function [Rhodovastum atsumiense]